ncbi:hypothetical protein ACFP81_06515 [Deinococcus lacus]|uniref:Uncharacterized protein n=1 Tax=Deinococcus lacus TaxID=392561 RepID=A0ABW1YBU8_9DEIO
MTQPTPRRLSGADFWAWVRDLRPLDARQREAFLSALALHYGQQVAANIRQQVERTVAA